jgi:hypothetical protein
VLALIFAERRKLPPFARCGQARARRKSAPSDTKRSINDFATQLRLQQELAAQHQHSTAH